MKCKPSCLAVAMTFCLFASTVCAGPLDDANVLLHAGKARQAYELLAQSERDLAGNVDFDYLLGRAALDAGMPSKATLVFERLLMVDPNHAGARLDMGRAYFALGDFERARNEFDSLNKLNPPPAARSVIKHYLTAIDNRLQPAKTVAKAYLEAGFGRDSNVNVGPRATSIYLPVFGLNFSIADSARAQSDNYHQVAAGGEILHPLSTQAAVFVGADIKFRNYNQIDPYDQRNGEIRGGLQWQQSGNTWRVFAAYNDFQLGHERYREITTLAADWRSNLTPRDQLTVFAQFAGVRYVPRELQGINYNQPLVGASWVRLPTLNGKFTLFGAAFVGREHELDFRSDGNKLFAGLRAGFSYAASGEIDVFAGAGWQYGRYARVNALYEEKRRDRQYDLFLGAQWRFSPGWTLRPQVVYSRNQSNTNINAFDRTEVGVFLRKDF